MKKVIFAPTIAFALILISGGIAPANAAHDNYQGPMRSLEECRKVVEFMKNRNWTITRECRQHDDGKWWFKMKP